MRSTQPSFYLPRGFESRDMPFMDILIRTVPPLILPCTSTGCSGLLTRILAEGAIALPVTLSGGVLFAS